MTQPFALSFWMNPGLFSSLEPPGLQGRIGHGDGSFDPE
jgi:hypothetical protein